MELTKFEHKLLRLVNNAINKGLDFDPWVFITDLRKIMPPTCTLNERKVLDEIRDKAKLISANVYVIYREPHKIGSVIFAKDFDANLSELVEGKQ